VEDFFKGLVDTLTHYGLVVATVASAVAMAIFRTAQRNGRVDLIESVICGIFAWGCFLVLGWLGLPEGGGVLIGGMIGYLGSSTIGHWLANRFGIKGKDDNEHNNKG